MNKNDCELVETIKYGLTVADNDTPESLSWLKKYKPKSFDDCLLKSDEKSLMDKWLSFLSNNKNEFNWTMYC